MSPLSLRSQPGAGSFHSAAPDFLHRRSPYEATCRLIASRLRRSMGLVRWPAKPASRLRRISSSLPNPLGAIPVTARRARRLRINSRLLPSSRPRSLAKLPAVRAVWPRWCKRRALTAEATRSPGPEDPSYHSPPPCFHSLCNVYVNIMSIGEALSRSGDSPAEVQSDWDM